MNKDSPIKPFPIIIFSVLAMFNGLAAFLLGVITLWGNKLLFTANGYGPNRIAISELFGVFAPQTGWIMLAIGTIFVSVGYGLFTFRNLVVWRFSMRLPCLHYQPLSLSVGEFTKVNGELSLEAF